jgi:hypothetical protein
MAISKKIIVIKVEDDDVNLWKEKLALFNSTHAVKTYRGVEVNILVFLTSAINGGEKEERFVSIEII